MLSTKCSANMQSLVFGTGNDFGDRVVSRSVKTNILSLNPMGNKVLLKIIIYSLRSLQNERHQGANPERIVQL